MLLVGTKLGSYEIRSHIGAGGMGEVYRAKDTKLNRDVAVKVLRQNLAADSTLLTRFAREARVLASLNHPNVAQIYGLEDSGGTPALVMELVPGETLSSLLRTQRLTLSIILNYAAQIAEALGAAHDQGIVHRDLKPANVMITPAGLVKVLDFGLAAVARSTPVGQNGRDGSTAATITATQSGVIMGTPAYMSPEQAAGRPLDRRTDIWSFGVVLWEMSTGKPLFEGDSSAQTLAAVFTKEPEWDQAPWKLRRLLRSCLQKDVIHRLRDIGDARLLLEQQDEPAHSVPVPPQNRWGRLAASAVAVALMVSFAVIWRSTHSAEPPVIRFNVDLGTDLDPGNRVAISPDGSRIGFIGMDANRNSTLFIRRLDQAKPTVLDDGLGRGTDAVPFFSPDSKWIGYEGTHKLKKVPVDGGVPVVVAEGVVGPAWSTWTENGDIVSGLTFDGLYRIRAAGGSPGLIFAGSLQEPSFLPGGKSILLSYGPLSILPIDGGKAKAIPGIIGDGAKYVSPGYILYVDENAILQGLPFDLTHLEARGPAFPLLEGIESFDVSRTGTLIGKRSRPKGRTLQWLDKTGKTEAILETPASYATPRVSPDGKRLAYTVRGDKGRQLWIYDLVRHVASQFTLESKSAIYPLWMPGGNYLLFRGSDGISVAAADGSSKPKLILKLNSIPDGLPEAISPDGRQLAIVREGKNTARDIWMVPLNGEGETLSAGEPKPFVDSVADEINPSFSPDGKWLAYSSTQTGTFTIYVRSLQGTHASWQISADEGFLPQWSPQGRQIIFHSLQDDRLWAASYSVSAGVFLPGEVTPFGANVDIPTEGSDPVYSFSPTGNRIAAVLPAGEAAGVRPHPNYILILNFLEEIKRQHR